ncbi:MAG: cytochrome c, class I [Gammaproteobacteria bacterium]|nr:cytochrome c, class I [Gammaproteobacteria bacterium]
MRRVHRGVIALLFGLLAHGQSQAAEPALPPHKAFDTPPAPVLTPAEALGSFALAPGFAIEPVAAEPLIEDPVAIAWDEAGNLYAAEMRGFMPDTYGTGQDAPVGAVVRLSDQDRDGVYDRREVLADQLVLPRAVAIVNEGLLIAEPPNLWLCPNTDGSAATIDCEGRISLGAYGDQPGSVEHAENGLLMGLDNWLYSAKSARRLRIVGGELVSEPTLFRGQWGISKDNAGRLYYNTNSVLLLGDSYDAQALVRAGNSGAPGLNARISGRDRMFAVRVNTGVNRAYVPGVLREDGRLDQPTSASGMAVYRGDQFGPEHADDVFVAEPAANAVARLRLHRDGLKVSAEHVLYPDDQWTQREFLASTDERFRPVDVKVGPDGALYVVDFYRGVIQDHVFISDELRAQAKERGLERPLGMGRIWRISRQDGGGPEREFGAAAAPEALLEWLGHLNGWQRDTAQRLLIADQGQGLRQRLAEIAASGPPLAAVHALWTLQGRGELTKADVLQALAHGDARVRLAGLEAGADLLSEAELRGLMAGSEDRVFMQHLILSLAPHGASPAVRQHLVGQLVADGGNAYKRAAVQAAAFGQEPELLQGLLASGAWNAEIEAATTFVANLVSQGLRGDSRQAAGWLDVAAAQQGRAWLARAILEGFFALTRDEGFARLQLAEPHPVFSAEDSELWPAIARARRSVTWPGDDLPANAKPLTPLQQRHRERGAQYYEAQCATCHGADGAGLESLGPPLAGTSWVTGPSEVLARIVLHGLSGPIEVNGEAWNGVMPGHAAMPGFDDETAAGLLTHLNRSWGHAGRAIDADFMARIRRETEGRVQLWTASELALVPVNTHYAKYQGRYGGGGFELQFVYGGGDLEVKSGIFNGPLREEREDHFIFEPRQMRLEFVLADDGSVTGVRMATPEGGVLLPKAGDP